MKSKLVKTCAITAAVSFTCAVGIFVYAKKWGYI